MEDDIKKCIEELKDVVLELHRNAGHLDQWIQNLEFDISSLSNRDRNDPEIMKIRIQHYAHFRQAHKVNDNYSSLDSRENSIWDKMLLACSKDEQES